MRTTIITLIALLTVLGTVGPALANHNDIGARIAVGDPDPVPTDEPDTSRDLTLVYHAGGTGDIEPNFVGTYPRAAPHDQTGIGMGEWIGFIDGVVEHMGPLVNQCAHVLVAEGNIRPCRQPDDPLFRVNPDTDAEPQCEQVEARLDPDQCDGEGHPWAMDFWPGVRIQPQHFDMLEDEGDGSGFLYPGNYGFYVYLFGDGSANVGAGEGAFSYLDPDLCTDHLAELKAKGLIPATRDTSAAERCKLITPEDLNRPEHLGHGGADGSSQEAAVCIFAPTFDTVSSPEDIETCPSQAEIFIPPSESAFYANNKPGWYAQGGFGDPFGSTLPWTNVVTMGGNHSDIAQMFHFYVNPARPVEDLFCAAPPIATSAPDALDTGVERNQDGTWTRTSEFHYITEAHDLDIYTGRTSDAALTSVGDVTGTVLDTVGEQLDEVLDQIPDLPPELDELVGQAIDAADEALATADETLNRTSNDVADAAQPAVDEVNAAVDRAFPTKTTPAEPSDPGTNTLELSRQADVAFDVCENGLNDPNSEGEPRTYYNWLDGEVTTNALLTAALRDFTYMDETGLPVEDDEQHYNPWHPSVYSFGGDILGFLDRNPNQQLDPCPLQGDPPATGEDLCSARIPWDVYNPDASRDDGTFGDLAKGQGFVDPQGMYFVLKVTGPMAILNTDTAPIANLAAEELVDRTLVIPSQGQHCVVGASLGLTDNNQDLDNDQTTAGERFRALLGLGTSATGDDIAAELCGDVSGEVHFLDDAFADQTTPGAFSSAISWAKLQPTPDLTDGVTGDGLTVHGLLTVRAGGDDLTAGNLDLGSHDETHPVVERVWADGSVTYQWTDVDLFQSQPAE